MSYNSSIINAYRNAGYRIHFYEGNTVKVSFDAFITAFTDSYEPEWEELPASLMQQDKFKRPVLTSRKISISFDIPSASEQEARTNLYKVRTLMALLYPPTNGSGTVGGISGPPDIWVKFANLITDFDGRKVKAIIEEAAVEPVVESGFFDPGPGQLYPKVLKSTISFIAITQDADPASRI